MRIGIIGHTGILGSAITAEFSSGNEIIGMSRSTGYDLRSNFQEIIDICRECDLVFNNAHALTLQGKVITALADSQVKLITSGSIAANYNFSDYCRNKRIIEDIYQQYIQRYPNRCLLLKMGYLQGMTETRGFGTIKLTDVISGIKFWLTTPRVTKLEFENLK
jgi:hypothetical protein